jgi:hypothetical protein
MSYNPLFNGSTFNGSSRQLITNYQNGTGIAIPQGTPVSTNSIGQIVPTDVTSQASVQAIVGYANVRIPSGAYGGVISSGRLENISTSFAIGDAVYIGLGGTLINTKPDYGVSGFAAGDWIVFVGVLTKNEFNPTLTDLQLFTQTIAQL